MNSEQQYITLFAQTEELICRGSTPVLNAPRKAAIEALERLGLPDRSDERYRYTDVAKYFEPDYGLNLHRIDMPVDPHDVFRCDVPNMSTSLYFMTNDVVRRDALGYRPRLPEGVYVGSLLEAARQKPELISRYYARIADYTQDGTTAINTAFAQDGFLIYVPKGVTVERPIQLVNILHADRSMMVNRRMLIVVEEGAQVKLLACDHSMDNVNFLATQVIEAYVAPDATLDLYELEESDTLTIRISNLYVRQEARSTVRLNGVTLFNGSTRNTTHVHMAGADSHLELGGMAITDKDQHVDNHTLVDVDATGCTCHELFKYVLDDRSTAVFSGLMRVQPGAQQTETAQTARGICMTREAHMYSRPQLEIYADDVKCSHGSTVGQLNDEALFYMRQRGIPEREAKLLLMFAFINEAVDHIRLEALRDRLHHLVEKRFRGELYKCRGCNVC